MTRDKFPQTDSIKELVEFFDTHDMTDYEEEFETIQEPAPESTRQITLDLPTGPAETIRKLASSRGVTEPELVREWVLEKVRTAK